MKIKSHKFCRPAKKSGMSAGVKIEKNASKWLLVSTCSSKDIIGKEVRKFTVNSRNTQVITFIKIFSIGEIMGNFWSYLFLPLESTK